MGNAPKPLVSARRNRKRHKVIHTVEGRRGRKRKTPTSIVCLLFPTTYDFSHSFTSPGRPPFTELHTHLFVHCRYKNDTMQKWSGCCFPVLSFLHVPGKMSHPLWLMMGTAFRVEPLGDGCAGDEEPATTVVGQQDRPLFLSAKHTFAPWDYTQNSADLKIPEDYRKARYVTGRMYAYNLATGDATAAQSEALSILSVHPTLDVALLSLRQWPPASPGADMFLRAPALPLLPAARVLKKDTAGVIEGFRGTGRLGELDTFDPSLLQKLPSADRDALLKDLQNVEGRQTRAHTTVTVLDPLGVCRGVGETHSACYHGMSGGPLVVQTGETGVATSPLCTGILYGKHPDHPQCIGYTPTNAFATWFKEAVSRFAKNNARGAGP